MTSTTIPSAASSRPARRALVVIVVVSSVVVLAVATWLTVTRGSSAGSTQPAPPIATWNATPADWLSRLEVAHLQKGLVAAGYSLRVDGKLGSVTKSALADYLRPTAAKPLGRSLAGALEGTVLTSRRDPAAWNQRFGLNRRTRFVERPLTGSGGQLDEHGNVRP